MDMKQNHPGIVISQFLFAAIILLLQACGDTEQVIDLDSSPVVAEHEHTSEQQHIQGDDQTYLFGFDLRASTQEDARQYLPFLEYLSQATGLKFKLRFTPRDNRIADDLGKGDIHFAAIGAVSYIRANKKFGVTPVARGLNKDNKAEYQSVLIVHQDSAIKSLADMPGKRMAFGSRSSTQGHLIPRIIMSKHNITLSELASYSYTGSHQNCANAVISGKSDICGLQDTMAFNVARISPIRVLHISDYYPSSGISANKDVPAAVLSKVKQALLDFQPQGKHAAGLYNWDKTEMPNGFTATSQRDYYTLHKWLEKLDTQGSKD